MHQSHDPSALLPFAFKMSSIVVLSKPCSSMLAELVDDAKRETIAGLMWGFATRTCWRTAFFTMLPCDRNDRRAPCIFTCWSRRFKTYNKFSKVRSVCRLLEAAVKYKHTQTYTHKNNIVTVLWQIIYILKSTQQESKKQQFARSLKIESQSMYAKFLHNMT